jgi:hypothetical protein
MQQLQKGWLEEDFPLEITTKWVPDISRLGLGYHACAWQLRIKHS